ncbi:MAG: hypothetical protein CYG61_02995, partial [Actinobacteria bacterium]
MAFLASPAHAAPGDLDASFDTDGIVTTPIGAAGVDDFGFDVAVQGDGRIVVAGTSGDDFAVVRYNPDGSLDTSFDTDGKVTTDIGGATVDDATGVALQPDGRIVVAGTSDEDFAVARYNADGSLDNSFDTDGKLTTDIGTGTVDSAFRLVLQPDGRIVVAGLSVVVGTSLEDLALDFAVVRYNANGSLDTSFGGDGKVTTDIGTGTTDEATGVALQPDGRIVVAGRSNDDFALVRYNADGSLDTSFDTDGKATTDIGTATGDGANAVAVSGDGRIVAGGVSNADFALARYNADGSLDTSFDTDGRVTTDIATDDILFDLALQPDGKVVAGGLAGGLASPDFAVARYNADGGLDPTFGTDGKVTTTIGTGAPSFGLTLQADGKILAAGAAEIDGQTDVAVARYLGDPGMSISDANATEGNTGTTNASFTVSLSAASASTVTVAYATADASATAPADYTSTSGTVSFAPGETSRTVVVPVQGDGVDEPNETFLVNLSNPTNVAALADAQGVGTIVDDDAPTQPPAGGGSG